MLKKFYFDSIRTVQLFIILFVSMQSYSFAQANQDRAAWMKDARWGVMNHFLADWRARVDKIEMNVVQWNKLVDNFDVEGLAQQVESVGAGYYLISIGQGSGYYLSPNATYDRFVGIQPSKCSRRDLVADLYEALHKRGIKLMVYLPSGAPGRDSIAKEALGWQGFQNRNRDFQLKWEQVIKEWSLRWGDKIDGWWFDGCFYPNTMYRYPDPPNFESFAAAARAGNPNSAVAFNPSLTQRIISLTPYEDYTGGEVVFPETMDIKRSYDGKIDGAQLHILSRLGEQWGMGAPRFSAEQAIKYSQDVRKWDGAITWDVPVQSNGLMSQEFIDQLAAIGKAIGRK